MEKAAFSSSEDGTTFKHELVSEIPTNRKSVSMSNEENQLERQASRHGRITYGSDVNERWRPEHEGSRRRSLSRDSMSIRSARRSVDPSIALPPQLRTLSFSIESSKRQALQKEQ